MIKARIAMANAAQIERHVLSDATAAARAVAEWLLERTLAVEGAAALCLAGGSTPRRVYSMLAEKPLRDRFPWARAHWFFGDERVVPSDSPRSNYRMVREALFDLVPIPPANIHPVPTGLGDAAKVAAAYEAMLQEFYGSDRLAANRALFAATLLGVGDNGHTASLFPASPALSERQHWAVGVGDIPAEPRVTLTIPTLESSGEVAFLVTGAGKHNIVSRLAQGQDLPAARIHPAGRLRWFLDRAAAGAVP
ncbi:MAG TPA: 6-phosphogluconolactonase [Stellaceae bacterium]|nr:6-phosphogluconolactonase [Stellaceae bacterium]